VNAESRAEGIKHYELSTQYVKIPREVKQLGGYLREPPNPFYFDCENDVLYISDARVLPLIRERQYNWCGILKKVQRLAIQDVAGYTPRWTQVVVPCWPALREVIVACEMLYPTRYNCEHLNQVVDFDDFKASLELEKNEDHSWIDDKRAELQREANVLRVKMKNEYTRSGPEPEPPKVRSMVIIPDVPFGC
jgi:hypothetical protein